jgi:hypothetical protein
MDDLRDRGKIYLFAVLWVFYSALHFCAVFCVMPHTPVFILVVHSLVRSFLLGISAILFSIIITFSGYSYLANLKKFINYIVLSVIIISMFLGIGYFVDYIFFGSETGKSFLLVYPFYGLIALLIYIIVIIINRSVNTAKNEIETPDEDAEYNETVAKNNTGELFERIAVKSGQKIHVIQVDDIYFLQADGDYVQIHTKNGKYLKEQTLKFFQEGLSPKKFARIHRSTIVNIEQISRIELFEKQNQQLTLNNGEQLKMSING